MTDATRSADLVVSRKTIRSDENSVLQCEIDLDCAMHHDRVRMAFKYFDRTGDRGRRPQVIGAPPAEIASLRQVEDPPEIAQKRYGGVIPVIANSPVGSGESTADCGRAVSGAVVRQHDLVVLKRLPGNAFEGGLDVTLAVENRQADAHQW